MLYEKIFKKWEKWRGRKAKRLCFCLWELKCLARRRASGEDGLLQLSRSAGPWSRGQLSLLKSNLVSPTRNNNVAEWPRGNDMIMLLCSGLKRRRSPRPALAVSLDYTDMRGLSKQKPGALSCRLVWHRNSWMSRTLASLGSLAFGRISHILFRVWDLLDISVKQSNRRTVLRPDYKSRRPKSFVKWDCSCCTVSKVKPNHVWDFLRRLLSNMEVTNT